MNGIGTDSLDIDAWAQLWAELEGQSFGFTLNEFISSVAAGKLNNDPSGLWQGIITFIVQALKLGMKGYAVMIGIAVISAIMGIISADAGTFGSGAFACTALGVANAAQRLGALASLAYKTVEALCGCIELIAPVLSTAIAATGSLSTSAAFGPLAAFLSQTVAGTFKNTVLPLCAGAGVCAMLSALSAEERLAHMFKLIKSAIRYISGGIFTIYFAILAVWGLGARASDSVAVKTAKYALDKGIPIVGGAVSGTMDSMAISAGLIKNSAGVAALITIALAVLPQLISIGCNTLCARGAAAICSALGDKRMPTLLDRLADTANGFFAAVCVAAAMFMLTCGLALGVAAA